VTQKGETTPQIIAKSTWPILCPDDMEQDGRLEARAEMATCDRGAESWDQYLCSVSQQEIYRRVNDRSKKVQTPLRMDRLGNREMRRVLASLKVT